jgi:hypothetical protein
VTNLIRGSHPLDLTEDVVVPAETLLPMAAVARRTSAFACEVADTANADENNQSPRDCCYASAND